MGAAGSAHLRGAVTANNKHPGHNNPRGCYFSNSADSVPSLDGRALSIQPRQLLFISRGAPVPVNCLKTGRNLNSPGIKAVCSLPNRDAVFHRARRAGEQQTPEDALQKFNEYRHNLVKAGMYTICRQSN